MPLDPITAKTAGAVAKAAGETADAIEKVGQLVDRAFGSMISNAVGLVSDKLAYYRLEKAILLKDKVDRRLREKGVDAARHVPVGFGLPLIEKASVEEDDSLHDKWANLLSNAMDPKYTGRIERSFVDILSGLEPRDAAVLDRLLDEFSRLPPSEKTTSLFDRAKLTAALGLDSESVAITLRNLMRLGLVKPGILTGGVKLGDEPITIFKDIDMFSPTELGIQFHRSVST